MMKGLVITTDTRVYPQVFEEPLYKSVGDVVQGWIEVVHPQGLPHPLCLICNEEGLLLDLECNAVASEWYGCREHGQVIVGNVVVMKEGYREGEPDIVGLSEDEIDVVLARIIQMGKDAGADLMLQDLGLPARGLRITEKRDTEIMDPELPKEDLR